MIGFRAAKQASDAKNLAKTLAQVILIWGLSLWVVPSLIVNLEAQFGIPRFSWSWQSPLGVLLFVAASSLGLWTGWTMAVRGKGTPLPMDTARELVISGPYSRVRNPMAIAGLTQGFAVSIYLGSMSVAAYSLSGGFVWHFLVRPAEEQDLRNRFGDSYVQYKRGVACWIPRATAYSGERSLSGTKQS